MMKIFNWFKKAKPVEVVPETSQQRWEREAKEALDKMVTNPTGETIRAAVDKSFLANFGHMYE